MAILRGAKHGAHDGGTTCIMPFDTFSSQPERRNAHSFAATGCFLQWSIISCVITEHRDFNVEETTVHDRVSDTGPDRLYVAGDASVTLHCVASA
jgi:hypothetical protein